jgi:hypothetical protein
MTVSRAGLLERLNSELPGPEAPDQGGIEDQARAVLRYVLAPDMDIPPANLAIIDVDPATCPNCGIQVESTRTPYCGEGCREMAGFVRQFRTGLELGWIFLPEKQVALGQVLWHVLGGGRPLRQQIAPAKAREKALKRTGAKCEGCGGVATTVDHVGSGCNRPTNLRAVCETCCQDKPFGSHSVLAKGEAQDKVNDLVARIGSPTPLRCCDDAGSWDWREYLKGRVHAVTQSRS